MGLRPEHCSTMSDGFSFAYWLYRLGGRPRIKMILGLAHIITVYRKYPYPVTKYRRHKDLNMRSIQIARYFRAPQCKKTAYTNASNNSR